MVKLHARLLKDGARLQIQVCLTLELISHIPVQWWSGGDIGQSGNALFYKSLEEGSNLLRWMHVDTGWAETRVLSFPLHHPCLQNPDIYLLGRNNSQTNKGLHKTSSMCFADRHFKKSCLDPNCSKWCLFTLIAVIGRRGLVSNETQTMELDTAKLENSLHSVLAMWSWASYETSLIPSIIIHRMKPEMCLRGVVGIRYNNPHAVLHTVTGVGGML